MVDLELCGALARAEQFPKKVPLEALERLHIPGNELDYWRYTLRQARNVCSDEALLTAIEGVVARCARADARLRRIEGTWAVLSRLGLTQERIKAVDRIMLRGKGAGFFRALQRRLHGVAY